MCDHDDCWDEFECCDECYDEGYEDGWNDRRSSRRPSSGGGSSPEGCYIATAVYGSYDCPEVWVLRRFRDYGLRRCAVGRRFVRAYYAVSPGLVRRFGHRERLCQSVRCILDAFVSLLKKHGFLDTAYYER